ncbi:MAG: IPT/TIG domain-containing protein [Planctomycetota bacterium]|nr:IPT/TIG domain-containing protein [Planctomycetota bacterium]
MIRRLGFLSCFLVAGLLIASCDHPHRHHKRHEPRCLTLDPTRGPSTGGTLVIVETDRFSDDFLVDIPQVFFGGTPAMSVTAIDSSTLEAVTPPDASPQPGEHVVDVVVEAHNGQECVFGDGFTYDGPPLPDCVIIDPRGGPCAGGTAVKIETAGFSDDFTVDLPRVFFGTTEALSVAAINSSSLEAVSPGTTILGRSVVDVFVEAQNGQECHFNDGFVYECPHGPDCISIDPRGGPCAGGTVVTIETAGFSDDFTVDLPRVFFGTTEASSVTAISSAALEAVSPGTTALGRIVVDVSVEAQNGQACHFNDGFVYECPQGPDCIHLDPNRGPYTGGTPVRVETGGFSDDFTVDLPRVFFGGVEATSVTAIDASTVVAETPPDPNPTPGLDHTVDVLVDARNGQECVFPDGFAYEGPARLACMSVDPNRGPLAGGNTVHIESLGNCEFDGVVEVSFGGVPATDVIVISRTQLSCTVPAGLRAGAVDVTYLVATAGGILCDCRLEDGYFYEN